MPVPPVTTSFSDTTAMVSSTTDMPSTTADIPSTMQPLTTIGNSETQTEQGITDSEGLPFTAETHQLSSEEMTTTNSQDSLGNVNTGLRIGDIAAIILTLLVILIIVVLVVLFIIFRSRKLRLTTTDQGFGMEFLSKHSSSLTAHL